MEDEEFDTDIEEEFEETDPKTGLPRSTKDVYLEACQTVGLAPSSKFLRECETSIIDLKHYGIGDIGTKPVAMAMRNDSVVTTLNLHDNGIRESGGIWIAKCLKDNSCLASLDLSGNLLGTKAVDALADALSGNGSLMELNLKECTLQDKGTHKLSHSLKINSCLRKLDMSYNEIGCVGAKHIGTMLRWNRKLEFLDLSWNSIRSNGAGDLAIALAKNKHLRELNVSWNGLSDEGAEVMEAALTSNTSLKNLDVSSNGLTINGARCFANALKLNRVLEILRIGRNPFQSAGARLLLDVLTQNKTTSLLELHLDEIVFDKDCVEQLTIVLGERPAFFCSWGVSIQGLRISKARKPELVDQFLSFVHNRGLRMLDLFRTLTKGQSEKYLTKEDFISGLKKMNIPLKDKQLREIFDTIDHDVNGAVTFPEFKACKSDSYQRRQRAGTSEDYRTDRGSEVMTVAIEQISSLERSQFLRKSAGF